MYGKIFDSIYRGTLHGKWEAIVTMQQLIVICDSEGVVDANAEFISSYTSIPLDIIERGLEILSQPDPNSRSPAEEGRRIVLIDPCRPWGWVIVNHSHYRDLVSREDKRVKDRVRAQEKRNTINDVAVRRSSSQKSHIQDTYTNKKDIGQNKFDLFWEVYPRKVKKKQAKDIWKRKKLDAKADIIIPDVSKRITKDRQWYEGYIPHPTTYLNGERWDDEIQAKNNTSEPEDEWKQAVRIAKEKNLPPFKGAPYETPKQFLERVRA